MLFQESSAELGSDGGIQCEHCTKICKAKSGMTRHIKAKHPDTLPQRETTKPSKPVHETKIDASLIKDFIESAKTKIMNNKCLDTKTKTFVSSDAPIGVELEILRKEVEGGYRLLSSSPEKFYHHFHVHIVDEAETYFPPPTPFPIAGLLALQLCEVIFLFYKKSQENEIAKASIGPPRKIEPTELDGLQNLAGYIVHKQLKTANKPKGNKSLVPILMSFVTQDIEDQPLIKLKSRGGLKATTREC